MTESPLSGTPVQGSVDQEVADSGSRGAVSPGDGPGRDPVTQEAVTPEVVSQEAPSEEALSEETVSRDRGGKDTVREPTAPGASADGGPAVHPRVWQRRVAVLREHAHRRLRWIVAGVGVLVLLCAALLVLHTPLLALRHASVRGAQHTGSQAVLQAAGLLDNPPLIDVDPKTAAAHVEALPWVAHAVVVRHWPDSVTITVTERVPVGSMARPGGGCGPGRRLGARARLAGRRAARARARRSGDTGSPRECPRPPGASRRGGGVGPPELVRRAGRPGTRRCPGDGDAGSGTRAQCRAGFDQRARCQAVVVGQRPGRSTRVGSGRDQRDRSRRTDGGATTTWVTTVTKMPVTWVWAPRVTVSLLDRFAVPPYREVTSAGPAPHRNQAVVEGEVTWCSEPVQPDRLAGFHDEARGSGRGEEG